MRRPNTIGSEWAPILKRSKVCMQRALRGSITKGPGWRKPAGLADHRTYVQRVAFPAGQVLGAHVHTRPFLTGRSIQEEHDIGHINWDQTVTANRVLIAQGT